MAVENISDRETYPSISTDNDMRFYLVAAAVSTLIASSAFAAPATSSFVDQDGRHYVGVETINSDGVTKVTGTVQESGEPFALSISQDGYVTGTMGESRVAFFASKKQMADLAGEMATKIAAN